MQYRTLGRSGTSVSTLCLGTMTFGDESPEDVAHAQLDAFVEAGGKIWVCSPCYKKRGYAEDQLIDSTTIVGGAKLVELLSTGTPHVSY